MIRRSTVATGLAVNQLTESGVLKVRSVGKQRYRVFEAPDVTPPDHAAGQGPLYAKSPRHRCGSPVG